MSDGYEFYSRALIARLVSIALLSRRARSNTVLRRSSKSLSAQKCGSPVGSRCLVRERKLIKPAARAFTDFVIGNSDAEFMEFLRMARDRRLGGRAPSSRSFSRCQASKATSCDPSLRPLDKKSADRNGTRPHQFVCLLRCADPVECPLGQELSSPAGQILTRRWTWFWSERHKRWYRSVIPLDA